MTCSSYLRKHADVTPTVAIPGVCHHKLLVFILYHKMLVHDKVLQQDRTVTAGVPQLYGPAERAKPSRSQVPARTFRNANKIFAITTAKFGESSELVRWRIDTEFFV